MRHSLLILLMALARGQAFAQDFAYEYQGQTIIYTVLDKRAKTCETKRGGRYGLTPGNEISGELNIPSVASDGNDDYSVVRIGESSFAKCSHLSSVIIPNSVTDIRDFAFSDCMGLNNVVIGNSVVSIGSNAFWDCDGLKSIILPNTLKEVGENAFGSLDGLLKGAYPSTITNPFHSYWSGSTLQYPAEDSFIEDGFIWGLEKKAIYFAPLSLEEEYIIPNTVTAIGDRAFSSCDKLTSVIIPPTVTSIGNDVFNKCYKLEKSAYPNTIGNPFKYGVAISYPVDGIVDEDNVIWGKDKYALYFVPFNIKGDFSVPISVSSIGNFAFYACDKLSSIFIPKEVQSIGYSAFSGCGLDRLKIYGSPDIDLEHGGPFGSLSSNTTIICSSIIYPAVKSLFNGKIFMYDVPFSSVNISSRLLGARITFEENPYYELDPIENLICSTDINKNGANISFKHGGLITGLIPQTEYGLYIKSEISGDWFYTSKFKTSTPDNLYSKVLNSTQTTITFSDVIASSDETIHPEIFALNESGNWEKYSGKKVTIRNLSPMSEHNLAYADYNGCRKYLTCKTKDISLSSERQIGPTTLLLKGCYDAGDAIVTHSEWRCTSKNESINGDVISLVGLTPASAQNLQYKVCVGNYTKTLDIVLNTTPLEIEILKPKCVSENNAIVAAHTNISDLESSVGFQWRKYDSPSSLEPNEAFAVVVDNVLEGFIKNLQPTSFYNVRAFYKDANGKYYYTKWTTFDPSDFSYFEPTVRTYPVEKLSTNSAHIRGYALQGTDEIVSQGVQYWMDSSSRSSGSDNVVTVIEVPGQVMEVDLKDLKSGTHYTIRAYVQTDKGFFFGEEQSFITLGEVSGVQNIIDYRVEPSFDFDLPYEIYHLNGIRIQGDLNTLPAGVYILYQNGKTMKYRNV